ncbi:hypothetical protein NDU88_006218 [Pleurodeles waltl]|uniref:Uncharacterized protein n=1 Tax=Pleurodeles waltl TaxID=8319 RepID=A0AAV7L588_PLEWA|nr:hypothetical protein NDU88_006218 [Pleurodeles waltl]
MHVSVCVHTCHPGEEEPARPNTRDARVSVCACIRATQEREEPARPNTRDALVSVCACIRATQEREEPAGPNTKRCTCQCACTCATQEREEPAMSSMQEARAFTCQCVRAYGPPRRGKNQPCQACMKHVHSRVSVCACIRATQEREEPARPNTRDALVSVCACIRATQEREEPAGPNTKRCTCQCACTCATQEREEPAMSSMQEARAFTCQCVRAYGPPRRGKNQPCQACMKHVHSRVSVCACIRATQEREEPARPNTRDARACTCQSVCVHRCHSGEGRTSRVKHKRCTCMHVSVCVHAYVPPSRWKNQPGQTRDARVSVRVHVPPGEGKTSQAKHKRRTCQCA